jgi:uncharacterized membrane protein
MRVPLVLAIVAFALLFAFVQVGAITVAFDKLGLSPNTAMLILLGSLLGSGINLPLFQLEARREPDPVRRSLIGALSPRYRPSPGRVIIGLNVGGGLIPLAVSLHLLTHHPLPPATVALAIGLQSALCYAASRPIRKVGIGLSILVAPLGAAAIASLLLPHASAPLAYIAGTLGVLIGADILRLGAIRELGVSSASIGGAGTFDGIFITGIVAVLLA